MDMLQSANADQVDKVFRLHETGIPVAQLAGRYGTSEKTIEAALKTAAETRTAKQAERNRKLMGV